MDMGLNASRLGQQLIHQGGLAMIHVGDDGNVPHFFPKHKNPPNPQAFRRYRSAGCLIRKPPGVPARRAVARYPRQVVTARPLSPPVAPFLKHGAIFIVLRLHEKGKNFSTKSVHVGSELLLFTGSMPIPVIASEAKQSRKYGA
jgi:hypothetical protein